MVLRHVERQNRIETGTIISPIVMTRKAWEAAKRKTVFYYNVMKDGVLL